MEFLSHVDAPETPINLAGAKPAPSHIVPNLPHISGIMCPGLWLLLTIFKGLSKGSPVLANRHPLVLLNSAVDAIAWFDTFRLLPATLIFCMRWFLALKGKISQFEVSVLAIPTTTSSPKDFFEELFRSCAELKDANREFNHVTSRGCTSLLLGLLAISVGGAIALIAIEGPFALAFFLFFEALFSSLFFGFLFYACGVGEQYARAAGRIATDPAFVLALEKAAASQKVFVMGFETWTKGPAPPLHATRNSYPIL